MVYAAFVLETGKQELYETNRDDSMYGRVCKQRCFGWHDDIAGCKRKYCSSRVRSHMRQLCYGLRENILSIYNYVNFTKIRWVVAHAGSQLALFTLGLMF